MTFRDKLPDFNKDLPTYQPTSLVYIGYNPSTGIYDFSIPILTGTNWLGTATEIVLSVKNNSTNYVAYVQPPSAGADISLSFNESVSFNVTDLITIYRLIPNAFTLGYNDFIDAYTSFYSYTPAVYVNDSVSIFTPDGNLTNLYRHDVGPHGEYYGNVYPSKVSILVNESPTETKVFDNYEIVSESIDITGANIVDDIFASIRIYNDYQNTDFQSLPIDGSKVIAKRKERTWNLSNLRNRVLYYDYNLPAVPVPSPNIFDPVYLSTTDPTILGDKVFGERLRDKYIIVDLEYDNINNYNFIFHTFKTHFRKSAR
jgi:hypothetical protein